MNRRWFRSAVGAGVLLTAGVFVATPAGAAAHVVTVSPNTGLTDGQVVQVTGSGFTETPIVNDWSVAQCTGAVVGAVLTLDLALANCDATTQPFTFVHADALGNLSTTFVVHTSFTPSAGAQGPVDCTVTPCALLVSQLTNAGVIGAAAPITFGGVTTCPRGDRPGRGYGDRHHCHTFDPGRHDEDHGLRKHHRSEFEHR
jgi:Neocarzinostatin family.